MSKPWDDLQAELAKMRARIAELESRNYKPMSRKVDADLRDATQRLERGWVRAHVYPGVTYTSAEQTKLAGVMAEIVDDTTPQLGGDLDVNDKKITNASGDIVVKIPTSSKVSITDSADVEKASVSEAGALTVASITTGTPTTYTQIYSTTSSTSAALTWSALTDNSTGTPDTQLVSIGDTSTSNEGANINNNFASLNAKLDDLAADLTNVKQVQAQIIDDKQAGQV